MALAYSIEVAPVRALLGERIVAVLRCTARSDAPGVMTFDHRSLVIELHKEALFEPLLVFPNRYAIEDKGQLVRLASTGGIEDLAAGEERIRSFDLLSLFPDTVLSTGRFGVTYRLEESDPFVGPPPAAAEISSGPGAVRLLIDHLCANEPAIRFRAAELLALMTQRDFGYDAGGDTEARATATERWRVWWEQEGSRLPWNYKSDGATFGQMSDAPPSTQNSGHLGGIAYPAGA